MASDASSSPISIANETIKRLAEHINQNFNAFSDDDPDEIDLDKCQRNVAYSIGNVYTNYNGLLLQERHRLSEIDESLKLARAQAYDDIKRTKLKYDVDTNGLKILLEGHELVRTKQMEYDKQESYVKFLENTVKQLGYYATGVKTMLMREEVRGRYGG